MFYFLIFSFFSATLAFDKNEYIKFHEVICKGQSCSLHLDISADASAWFPIFINVTLGHSMRPNDGIVQVYDTVNKNPIVNAKNYVEENILSMAENKRKTLGCNVGECAITVCTSRGLSEFIKDYDSKIIDVTWSPMITFDELWFGPKLKFTYSVTNGVSSPLKLDNTVYYWGDCSEPNNPFGEDESAYINVQYED